MYVTARIIEVKVCQYPKSRVRIITTPICQYRTAHSWQDIALLGLVLTLRLGQYFTIFALILRQTAYD